MNNKFKISLLIVLVGYLSSIAFYFVWYWTSGSYLFNPMRYTGTYVLDIAIVIFAITLIYFFTLLLIWYTKSLQDFWTSFFVVSIITLLTFFLIPSSYYASYHIEKAKENARKEQKRMKEIEAKLNTAMSKNNTSEKIITRLKATLRAAREENVKLNEQLKEKIRKLQSFEAEQKTKENIVSQAKSIKNLSKIKLKPKMVKTGSDTKNQEIIFRVQIITSSRRLAKNSPRFKNLEGIWEYKDGGEYKYTIGNKKDLKSASALQSDLREKGFSGAFVAAFKNGKRIPISEAKKLLAEHD